MQGLDLSRLGNIVEMPKELVLPNVRKLFIPDQDEVIFDCDLAGADAQVVAWEAGDEKLKKAFREGLNVHNENGRDIWGEAYNPTARGLSGLTMRNECKRGVHGTNYGATARTLALTLGWKIKTAEEFQARWFYTHPAIKEWQNRVDYQVQTTSVISNAFGYRFQFFDRPDNLLPAALAWGPQSTIARCCARGANALRKYIPFVRLRLQIHDSVVFTAKRDVAYNPAALAEIKHVLHQASRVPYKDELIVPWEIAQSSVNWGECEKINWDGTPKEK